MLPDGSAYLIGRPPEPFPYWVPCAACKRTTKLTAADYARLPTLTVAELEAFGAKPLRDLEGAGYSRAQAEAIFTHAAGPAALEELLQGIQSTADTKAETEAKMAAAAARAAKRTARAAAKPPAKRKRG